MDTTHIPEPLRTFVARSLVNLNTKVVGTQLEQRGEMRLKPDQDFMPFTAEQFIAAHRTEFLWHARVRMAPFVTAVVEDAFERGHGRLDAKIWGLLPVARGRGELIDRGETQRYLAELPYCPFAFLHNRDIQYVSHSKSEVRAWIGEETCYVDLRFDAAGDLCETFTTTRVRDDKAEPWRGRFSEYRDFGPIRAPAKAEVAWEPPAGRFLYWKGELVALHATVNEPR